MDVHKDCYSAIDLTQQDGPHRRETKLDGTVGPICHPSPFLDDQVHGLIVVFASFVAGDKGVDLDNVDLALNDLRNETIDYGMGDHRSIARGCGDHERLAARR